MSFNDIIQAGLGRSAEARRLARRVLDAIPRTLDYWRWRDVAWDAAEVYAQAGAHDEAIDQLTELMRLSTGWSSMRWRANPMFDSFRRRCALQGAGRIDATSLNSRRAN